MQIHNKVVVVSGASRGLGRHLVRQLAGLGATVYALARDAGALQALAAEYPGQVYARPLNIEDSAAIRHTMAEIETTAGRVDVLINNAGLGWYKPFLDHSPAELDSLINVNFVAAVHLCHAVLPGMRARQSGHILNIGSDLARRPLANMAVYAAAKHAMAGFSHSLLREVKTDGIKVSLINPGIIDTDFGGGSEGSRGEEWSLRPADLAHLIVQVLQQPGFTVVDELSVHPLMQGEY